MESGFESNLTKVRLNGEELEFIKNSHLTKSNEWTKLQKAVQKL